MTSLFTNMNQEKCLCLAAILVLALVVIASAGMYRPYHKYSPDGALIQKPEVLADTWSWRFPAPAGREGAIDWSRIDRSPFSRKTVRFKHPKATLPLPAPMNADYSLPAMDPFVDIRNFDALLWQARDLQPESILLAALAETDGPFWTVRDFDFLKPVPGVATPKDTEGGIKEQKFDVVTRADGSPLRGLIVAETPTTLTLQTVKDNGDPTGFDFKVNKSEIKSITRRKSVSEVYKDISNGLRDALKSGEKKQAQVAEERYLLAMACLQSHLLNLSIDELWTIVKEVDPKYEAAYLKLGDIYFQQTRSLNDALAVYQAATAAGLDSPEIAMRTGFLYYHFYRKELSGLAIEAFERAARHDAYREQALAMLGRMHLVRDDLASAREAFERLASLDAGSFWLDNGNGLLHLREGRLQTSVDDFTAALGKARAREQTQLAAVDALAGNAEKEGQLIAEQEKLFVLERTIGEIYNNRGATRYCQGRLLDAYADFRLALDYSPGDARILVNLGLLFTVAGLHEDARSLYDTAEELILMPTGRISFGRGVTAVFAGADGATVEKNFNLAEAMGHDLSSDQYAQIHFFRGLYDFRKRAAGFGQEHFRGTMTENPYFMPAYLWLAQAMELAGESAEATLLKAVNAQPNNTTIRYQAAHYYLQPEHKDYSRAEEQIEAILLAQPEHAFALPAMGYLSYLDGNTERAVHSFSRTLDLVPDDALSMISLRQIEHATTREIERYDFDRQPGSPEIKNGWEETENSGLVIALHASETMEQGEVVFSGEASHRTETSMSRELTGDPLRGFVRFEADLVLRDLPTTGSTEFGIHVGRKKGGKAFKDAIRVWVDGNRKVHHFGVPDNGKTSSDTDIESQRTVGDHVTLAIERENTNEDIYNIIVDGQIIHTFVNKGLISAKKDLELSVYVVTDVDETVDVAVDEVRIVVQADRER